MRTDEPLVEGSQEAARHRRQRTWIVAGIAAGLAGFAVVGSVAMLLMRNVSRKLSEARRAAAAVDIVEISVGINEYMAANDGHAPESLEVLVKADQDGATYLSSFEGFPRDPWNSPYVYEPPREGRGYHIFTLGRDCKPGGEGEDADIDNLTMASKRQR